MENLDSLKLKLAQFESALENGKQAEIESTARALFAEWDKNTLESQYYCLTVYNKLLTKFGKFIKNNHMPFTHNNGDLLLHFSSNALAEILIVNSENIEQEVFAQCEDKILRKADIELIIRLAGCEKADFAKCQNAVLRCKSCTLIKEFYLAYPNKVNMRAICQRVKVLSETKPEKNQTEDRKEILTFFQEKNKTKFLHDCEEYAEKRAEYMYARR